MKSIIVNPEIKKLIPTPIKKEVFSILIVDDVKDNLIALNAILERKDVTIFQALSGKQALELMMKYDFCLALLDVQMPEMSGFELAAFMRGSKKTKNIPIIFVTANAKEQDFSFKGYESGAVDFLIKPLDTHAVRSKVNIFVELYQQKNELKLVEAKFRGLLESAPDSIVIVNEKGRIELVNKQTDLLFGYDRSELIGQPMEILLPERFHNTHVHHRTGYTNHPSSRPMGKGLNSVCLTSNFGFSAHELREVQSVVAAHRNALLEAWYGYFGAGSK